MTNFVKMLYLYLKTHQKTGLKYLGQTIRNPFTYKGSGKRWTNHLKVHGNDVSTEILKECHSREELKKWGLYYSQLWNIVDNSEFANCTMEEGTGGLTFKPEDRLGEKNPMYGKKNPCSTKKRLDIIKTKNEKVLDKMKEAVLMLNNGYSTVETWKKLDLSRTTVIRLNNRTHGFFDLFPELK